MSPTPPLSLYLHIPWCVRKCPYCDFNSHAGGKPDEPAYVKALLTDLEQELPLVKGRTLTSIFIGGGTPSLFSGTAIGELLDGVRARIGIEKTAEINLEANPGTLEAGRYREYRQAGVNRLSIGVQSFDDQKLQTLGRIHSRSEALAAIEQAKSAGFENLNLDLMYGLPSQTVEQALADVRTAIETGPSHISYYQLTLEPGTAFEHNPPELPDDDLLAEIEEAGREELQKAGYRQYEISAFARPGKECKHNLNYWRFGDYLGIGAGAHGKLTVGDKIERRWRVGSPERYIETAGTQACIAGTRVLQEADRIAEFMLNALRLTAGFTPALFQERTGLPWERIAERVELLERRGLLERADDSIRPTPHGHRFLNEILMHFLPETEADSQLYSV